MSAGGLVQILPIDLVGCSEYPVVQLFFELLYCARCQLFEIIIQKSTIEGLNHTRSIMVMNSFFKGSKHFKNCHGDLYIDSSDEGQTYTLPIYPIEGAIQDVFSVLPTILHQVPMNEILSNHDVD